MTANWTRCIIWAACLAVSATWACPADAGVRLRFKDNALILARMFTLGDIVTLEESVGGRTQGSLAGVTIGRTPRPGQSQQITRFEVESVLEKSRPGITRRIQWHGPTSLRVRGGGVRCDMQQLQHTARQYLHDHLVARYGHARVSVMGDPEPIAVTAGEITYHPRLSPARPLASRMPVWVDIHVDKQHFQTLPLWFSVSVRQPVWVVQKKKAAKQPLADEDAVRCVKDIAGLGAAPLAVASLADYRSMRDLPEGRILTEEDAAPMPAVCEGDWITVISRHGGVEIQIKAVAMADGRVSDQIAVRNPGSGQSFRAMVIGNRQARVN